MTVQVVDVPHRQRYEIVRDDVTQDDRAQSGCREHGAYVVKPGDHVAAGGVGHPGSHHQDEEDQENLAEENQAPGQLRGEPSADDRADGDAGAGHPPITA